MRAPWVLTVFACLLFAAPANAIVGGEPTTRSWPHMALVEYRDSAADPYEFICGGSLVAPDVILTAAHCVDSGDASNTLPAANFRFMLGSKLRNSGGERIAAVQILEHPDWDDSGNESADVALVKLARSSTLGAPISLAQAADAPQWQPNDPAVIIGWGQTAFAIGDTPNELHEATVPIVSDATCSTSYAANPAVAFDPATDMCAGEETGGKDTCQGDSGGPLMVQSGGAWKLVGVVSEGLGCAYPAQYGIYAEAAGAALKPWIETNRAALSSASQQSGGDGGGSGSGSGSTGGSGTPSSGGPAPSPAPAPAPSPTTTALLPTPNTVRRASFSLPSVIGSLRSARRRGGFVVRLQFNIPVTVTATLTQGRRAVARGATRRRAATGTLKLKFLKGRRVRAGRATLKVVVKNAAGRSFSSSRSVTLGR